MKYLKTMLEIVIDIFISVFAGFTIYYLVLKFFGWAIPIPLLLLIMIIIGTLIDVEVD
mgnify:CR=1 FL=1